MKKIEGLLAFIRANPLVVYLAMGLLIGAVLVAAALWSMI